MLIFTLCAKLSGAVYCYRSCLWRAGVVCLRVCYHDNLKLRAVIFTKLGLYRWSLSDHLQMINFWLSCAPGKGVCDWDRVNNVPCLRHLCCTADIVTSSRSGRNAACASWCQASAPRTAEHSRASRPCSHGLREAHVKHLAQFGMYLRRWWTLDGGRSPIIQNSIRRMLVLQTQ